MANIFDTLKASGLMDLDSKSTRNSSAVEKVVIDGIDYYEDKYSGFWTSSQYFYFDAKGRPKYAKCSVHRWEYYHKKVLPTLLSLSKKAYQDGDTRRGEELDRQYQELFHAKNNDKSLYADLKGTDGLMTRAELDKLAKSKAAK